MLPDNNLLYSSYWSVSRPPLFALFGRYIDGHWWYWRGHNCKVTWCLWSWSWCSSLCSLWCKTWTNLVLSKHPHGKDAWLQINHCLDWLRSAPGLTLIPLSKIVVFSYDKLALIHILFPMTIEVWRMLIFSFIGRAIQSIFSLILWVSQFLLLFLQISLLSDIIFLKTPVLYSLIP